MRVDKSPLTWDDVKAIRASSDPSHVIAERYGMTAGGIRTIRLNRTWHDPGYTPDVRPRVCLTEDDARMILASDDSARALARQIGCEKTAVLDVRHGRTFKHLTR